jgi:transglutaminase-like putative cysteine protease
MTIPNGVEGVKATLKLMKAKIRAGKVSPYIRAKALEITAGLRQKNRVGEIFAVWKFVRDRIRYVRDIRNVETLQDAEYTLTQGAGDCDDKAILTASLLESIGHPTALWAIGFKPGKFSHVLPLTRAGAAGKWMPLETTEAVRFGWRPKNIVSSLRLIN